jgi:hypothetical protein
VRCRYKDGVFMTDQRATSMFDKLDAKRALLDACRFMVANGAYLSTEELSRSGLIPRARKMKDLQHFSMGALRDAQKALLDSGDLVQVEACYDRKWLVRVRPSIGIKYPIERPLSGHGNGLDPEA